ncbi:MAG: prepilin-type N-terminal cleavage/methylation domain-containing protein [Phycisphaerales bacterium]
MPRRAFTIIEVLAALALLAILVTLIVGSMNTMRVRADWVRDRAARHREVSIAIDRLATALTTTMVDAATVGVGVKGDASQIAVLSRTRSLDPAASGDIARFELRADAEARTIRGAWAPVFGEAGPGQHELGSGAITRFRYHDGDAWRGAFDSSQSGSLPVAVEISVWFQNAEADASEETSERQFPAREPDRRRVIAIADARGGAR